MRLYSYRTGAGQTFAGRLEEGLVTVWHDHWTDDLSGAAADSLEDFLAAQAGSEGRQEAIEALTPAPAVPRPGKIICIGLNYRDHVSEGAGRTVPERPLLFGKFGNTVIADGEPIVRPNGSHALDLEVELGVVIGRRARRVRAGDAMSHVAGYVVVNDVSARDWQGSPPALREGQKGDGQWLRAKGSDTFLPMGPVFVTADELDPAAGLELRSSRITSDGTRHPMQRGSTADLIWSIPELIEHITASVTLEPGDVIATGTPAGVGVFRDPPVFLQPGDRVRCEIDGIGSVENPVIDWSDAAEDPGDG